MRGIPVFGTATGFAVRCQNEGLGWSDCARRYPPSRAARADDNGCPKDRRGGERRPHAPSSACTHREHDHSCPRLADASFARSFDPCSSILATPGASRGGGAFESASRLGKPTEVGETNTGADWSGRCAARRASSASARKRAGRVRKGRRSRPPSLRGSRAPVWLLARRMVVAEIGRQWLTPNKLGKRAPKRAVRVE